MQTRVEVALNEITPKLRNRTAPQKFEDPNELHTKFVVPATEFNVPTRPDYDIQSSLSGRQTWRRKMRAFNFLFLVLPPLAAAGYLFFYATNAYQVDSIVAIRNPTNSSGSSSSMGAGMMSGVASGGSTSMERAIDESYAVVNYILSREAFDELNKKVDLKSRFQRDNIDWLGRLRSDATHEQQYQYYLKHVDVSYDDVEGQVDLSTYAYDADTAFAMASELSKASEHLVNQFNERSQADLIKLARQQVADASTEMRNSNEAITKFQIANTMIDPGSETTAFGVIINTLRGQASAKRSELSALEKTSSPTSPRSVEIRNMLEATERQIKDEQSKLTGQAGALAPLIGTYKLLATDAQLAQQKYASAVAMLQSSLIQAEHQKLYVVNIVSPTLPVQPILPNRSRTMIAVLAGTLVAWLIARLGMAAIRDHRI